MRVAFTPCQPFTDRKVITRLCRASCDVPPVGQRKAASIVTGTERAFRSSTVP